jgi:hypothetical protein
MRRINRSKQREQRKNHSVISVASCYQIRPVLRSFSEGGNPPSFAKPSAFAWPSTFAGPTVDRTADRTEGRQSAISNAAARLHPRLPLHCAFVPHADHLIIGSNFCQAPAGEKSGQTHRNFRVFLMRAARRDPLHARARALPEAGNRVRQNVASLITNGLREFRCVCPAPLIIWLAKRG